MKDGHATVVVDETDSHIFVIDPSGNSIEIPFWENVAARVGIDYSAELSAKKKVASEIVSQYGLDTVTDKGGRTMSAEEWINKSK